jgi:SOS response regulatory protein OraA/RecX
MYKARAAEAEAETAELKARAAEAEAETAEAEARAETAEAETAELKAKTAQIAFQLVRKGFSEEESSAMTGVPVEEIRKALQA